MKWVASVTRLIVLAVSVACNGTTGDQLISSPRTRPGAGGGVTLHRHRLHVQLTTAKMHIGAVYINEAPHRRLAFETPVCINPGIYAAQVAGPVEVDLLNAAPQPWVCGVSCAPSIVGCNVDGDGPPGEACQNSLCIVPMPPTVGSGIEDTGQSWELWLTDAFPQSTSTDAGGAGSPVGSDSSTTSTSRTSSTSRAWRRGSPTARSFRSPRWSPSTRTTGA